MVSSEKQEKNWKLRSGVDLYASTERIFDAVCGQTLAARVDCATNLAEFFFFFKSRSVTSGSVRVRVERKILEANLEVS